MKITDKRNALRIILMAVVLLMVTHTAEAQRSVVRKLKKIPGVVSVEEKHIDTSAYTKYLIWFEQPVDHNNPAAGTFRQRVWLIHAGFDQPMVMTTEGYAAEYANRPWYRDEIADMFGTNNIVVEHRYFGWSVPSSGGWDPLTVENAAADHHRIIQAFKRYYSGKWLTTGISKGGTTALIHKVLYPDDVDITVAYVAPVNYGLEDGRHESFIATNGSPEYRAAIASFQTQMLMRRGAMIPLLENYIAKNELTFRIPVNELYDYLILEYAFAFYQWGWDIDMIPDASLDDAAYFMHLVVVSEPEYFSVESGAAFLPFFVQASRQLGYYGYEIWPYNNLMEIETTEGYLKRVMLPDSIDYTFDGSISARVQEYFFNADPKVILIYGEWDPWTASAVIFDSRLKKNLLKIVKAKGSHRVRIRDLNEPDKKMVLDRLNEWLYEK
jgi:hypothetical protein